MQDLIAQQEAVNRWMERVGVRFGVYKGGVFHEQIFPFDPIPRVIVNADWRHIERGLRQRVAALNAFLSDIYSDKKIMRDGVIPEEFIYSSKGFLPQCDGLKPPRGIYAHISGIDLVQAKSGEWIVLEDNLRIPSGASYPIVARKITRKVSPCTYEHNHVADNRNYPDLLAQIMDYANIDAGLPVIFTPGRFNSAFFEHSFLAEKTGATLAFPGDLVVDGDAVYYKGLFHSRKKVGVIYRRLSDEFLDPLTFDPNSMLGVPNLMRVYAKGQVAIMNAPGNGIADDKGLCYFVPKMISYYLGENAILANAPTYLPFYEKDRQYVLDNLDRLVIKDVAEAGGYGVIFGCDLSRERREELKNLVITQPRRWIAQEVIDFIDLEVLSGGERVYRKADLRAFVLHGQEIQVWKSGLTRFSRIPNSYVVNSSQGGGFKDTWIVD